MCAEERASLDGKLAGLSRDWVALDSAIQDNLERMKGGELMLRETQSEVEVLKRCQGEQTSIMASVNIFSFVSGVSYSPLYSSWPMAGVNVESH